jgi:serine/threonine protein kinase
VSNTEDDSQQGYLKFVKEGQKEIEILRYLTGIESPSNYTISPVQIWPVQGGNVNAYGLEAVDLMHQHGVAHLNLKPPNILLPVDGGRLSIIDFNKSVRVKGTNTCSAASLAPPDILRLILRLVKAPIVQSVQTCGPVERHLRSCVLSVGHLGIATRYSRAHE